MNEVNKKKKLNKKEKIAIDFCVKVWYNHPKENQKSHTLFFKTLDFEK